MSIGLKSMVAAIAICFCLPAPEAQAQEILDLQQDDGRDVIVGLMIKVDGKWAPGELQELVLRFARENSIPVNTLREQINTGGWWLLDFPQAMQRAKVRPLVEQLKLVPRIKYVEADVPIKPASVPNDDGYTDYITGWEIRDAEPAGIRGESSWDIKGGLKRTATMTVIDTGMIPDAEVYAASQTGWDFYANKSGAFDEGTYHPGGNSDPCGHDRRINIWHGLQVASMIAAITNNDAGMSSIGSWSAKGLTPDWVPIRVDGCKGGKLTYVANGIRWSVGQAQVTAPAHSWKARAINISMGADTTGDCPSYLQDAIDYATSQKAVVVVAAGNKDPSGVDAKNYAPANCQGVVVVTNHDRSGKRWKNANFGTVVTLSAPGSDVTVRKNDADDRPAQYGTYRTSTAWGTSVAAPLVTVTLGRMFGNNPALTPAQAIGILKETSRPFLLGCPGCGVGMLDATAAIKEALPNGVPDHIDLTPQNVVTYTNRLCTYMNAKVIDTKGKEIAGSSVSFASSNPGVIAVTTTGPLTATACPLRIGSAQVLATKDDMQASSSITVLNSSCPPSCKARKPN